MARCARLCLEWEVWDLKNRLHAAEWTIMELQNKLEQVKSLEHPAEMAATGISSHDAEADNSSPVHGLPMVKLHRLGEEEDQLDASAHEAGNQTEAEEGLQTAQHIYIGSLSDADDARVR